MMRKLLTLRKNIFHRGTEEEQDTDNLTNSTRSSCVTLEHRVRGVSFTPSHFLNVSPVVLSLLQHLNDEEWDRIEETMHSSMTRSQFTTLCTDIVGWVSEAASKIILPALALVLDVTVTESSSPSTVSRSQSLIFEESPSLKELSSEDNICEARQAEKKSTTGAVAAKEMSSLKSEDAEESSSAVAPEAAFDSSTIAVDLPARSPDHRALCQPPVKNVQESSVASSAKRSTTSFSAEILAQLSSKFFEGAGSEMAEPLLAEDMSAAASSSVSLKSDADSAASDIVTIVLRDLHSMSGFDFSPESGSTSPQVSRNIFQTMRCKIRDFFSDLHPLSLNKLSRQSDLKESYAEKTTTSTFNGEAPVSGAERTATNIVDIVLHWITQDPGQITPVTPRTSKSGPELKFDMLLSKENLRMLSPQLVGKVHRLIMEDNGAVPVITLAARRVNSDSAILKARGGPRLELARGAFSELVYIFTEKCVRKLLQECLCSLSQHRPSASVRHVTTPVASSSPARTEQSSPQSEASTIPGGKSPRETSSLSMSSSHLMQLVLSSACQDKVSKLHSTQSPEEALKPSLQLSSPNMETLINVMAQEVIKLLPEKIDDSSHGSKEEAGNLCSRR